MARRATVGYRVAKFVRRNRWGVAAACTFAALCCIAAGSIVVQSARVARERDKAQRVSRFLVEIFNVSDPGEARGNSVTAREVLDKGAERIHSELKDEPEVRAALLNTIGTVYDSLGLYDKAVPLLREALELTRRDLGGDPLEVATALNSLGNVLLDKGDTREAAAAYREALGIRRRHLSKGSREVAESLNNLASAADAGGPLRRGGRPLSRGARDQEAAPRRRGTPSPRPSETSRSCEDGRATGRSGDAAARADRSPTEVLGSDHPELAAAMEMLATVLDSEGDYEAGTSGCTARPSRCSSAFSARSTRRSS